jgi:Alkylmercury lyase
MTSYPHTHGTNMRRSFCDSANAFRSHDHLDAWRATHGNPPREALTVDQVTLRGRAIWAPEARCWRLSGHTPRLRVASPANGSKTGRVAHRYGHAKAIGIGYNDLG